MSSDIKVSVCVVTYNQEKYIAECLQSLVDQVTDFPFEIIVGEDCSTDRTREIVLELQKRYPDIIKPLLHVENVGPVENILATYKQAKGKYIAHMDGDDLALPGKLQKQFDILQNNSGCTICSHDVSLIRDNGKKIGRSFKRNKEGVNTLLDLYDTLPFFAHSSKMFVNDLNLEYWKELHPEALDIEIHVEQAKRGNIYHLGECYGSYRVFTGITAVKKRVNPKLPNGTKRIFEKALRDKILDVELVKMFYAKALFNYAYQSALLGDKLGLVKYVDESISYFRFSKIQVIFSKLSVCPVLVVLICRIRSRIKGY